MTAQALFLNLMLGVVGSAFMLYGRKQGSALPLVCGLLLIVTPYVLSNLVGQLLAGLVLVVPPLLRR